MPTMAVIISTFFIMWRPILGFLPTHPAFAQGLNGF
jgi:hypothetical protein